MSRHVYTVGDTIRLEVSFVSESNIDEVHAFYIREETTRIDKYGGRDVTLSPLSMEGSVEETTIEESRPYMLPLKRHTATLISLVDRDHLPGSYRLDMLRLRTASGGEFYLHPGDTQVEADTFRIAEESSQIVKVRARIVPETDEE